MSKILLEKINNILDINKNREYININNVDQQYYLFLNKFVENNDDIDNLISKQVSLKLTFCKDYLSLSENLKNINNFDSLKLFCQENEIDYKSIIDNLKIEKSTKNIVKKVDKLNNNIQDEYLINKKKIYELITTRLLKDVNLFLDLKNHSKKLFIETGKQLLKLGTNFVSGYVNNVYINAPLITYNAEIDINLNEVYIKIDHKPIINEKLILYILKQLEVNRNLDLSKIIDKHSFKSFLEPFIQYQIDDLDIDTYFSKSNNDKRLTISNIYCLGIFDIEAGKIKEDFLELMKNNVELLNDKMQNDFEFYTKEEFNNKALIQINRPLNIYQKYAVRSSISENTLIYGPPGTGKSEIITSIIANLLINQKSILVCSEKDAALDVIKKRLSELSIFAFYLKDLENEDLFYEQIENLSLEMGSFYNDYYKNEEFNLLNIYNSNDRVKDYNEQIAKFRQILNEDISFSLETDSRGNDYKQYLISVNEVNEFIKHNKTGINQFWEEYKNKFVKLQSPTEFISKVAEFNWFKEKYELNEDEINKFDFIRNDVNYFIANNDNIDFKIDDFDLLKSKVEKLDEFIQNQMLHKDKDFVSTLNNNVFVLKNNYVQWNKINELLKDKQYCKYAKKMLIRNCAKHEKFLTKYLVCNDILKQNLIQRYFYKSEINTSKMMFKAINEEQNDIYLNCVKAFEKITIFKSNWYLNYILDYDQDIFDPIVVYFYNNKNLLKKSFIDFYNKQIINFDQRIVNQYYKYRVNQIERELININVYSFEKLNKNKHIIERNIPDLISKYLKNNSDFILNIDKTLKSIYIKHIKNVLAKSDKELQTKCEKMFKIVRFEQKPKINDFINEFYDCLKIIFPIWLSKPDLVSFYVPNKQEQFDIGIFDEASQMFLERAYPIIYRCKQLIISGDDKQLKPERFAFYDLDINNDLSINDIDFDKSESLLDRVKVSYWNTYTLRNHYRSQSKELIEFSNNNFYNGNLLFTNQSNNSIKPLEVINSNKTIEKGLINTEEVKNLIKVLKENISKFNKILVICFSIEQKQYLLDLLLKDSNEDINLKLKNNKLIIGDLTSVQGDEGDLVLISTVYTSSSNNYGVLSKHRGSNYLNVVITRSKDKMIVFKSLYANDIKVNYQDKYDESIYFKKWIAYLDDLSINKSSKSNALFKDDNMFTNFKKDVLDKLSKSKYFKSFNIESNIKIGNNKIDIAIYKSNVNNIDLILILDDWKKNIDIQSWFEDIDKQEYLLSRNYNVIRIREQDWLKDHELVLDKLKLVLEQNNNN